MKIHGYKVYKQNMATPFYLVEGTYGFLKNKSIHTKMITDGDLINRMLIEEKTITPKIKKKEFGYAGELDRIIKEAITLKDANYLIQVLIATKVFSNGFVTRVNDVITDIDIYLDDINDQKILHEVRSLVRVLAKVEEFRTVYDSILPDNKGLSEFDIEKQDNGIFKIKSFGKLKKVA